MFCTRCGKEIREGVKFCTNCGAAVNGNTAKIEPKAAVTETPVIMENQNDKMLSGKQNGENKLHVGLIILIIVIICGALWFLGGRELIYDVVESYAPKKITDDISDIHIKNKNNKKEIEDDDHIEEIEDDNDHIEEIEASENGLEIAEEEEVEDKDTDAEEAAMNSDEFIEEEEEVEEPSEYIIENSDTRYITKDDLIGMTAEECRLARNELYARHGRKFDDEGLQSYFEACSWYHGFIEASDFQESMLNDIEIANRDLIVEYEKEMGYR